VSGGTTADETKRAVCKAFTSVVKSGLLAVDPKAFFMMLNTNYAMLVQDRRINLGPLWDAMAGQHPAEQLHGVFLVFRLKAMDLGLKVVLPQAVDALSEAEMQQAMRPWQDVVVAEEPTPSIPLSTADIKPFVPDESRRQIVQIVSSAIRNSNVGAKFDAAHLTFQIDSAFESLFDGRSFDLAQIFEVLRQSAQIEDADVYTVVARAKMELTPLGFGVIEPKVGLNSIEKQNVVDEIRRADERAAKRTGTLDIAADKPPEESSKRITREERLKEYGLDSVNEKLKKRAPIRTIVLGVVAVAAGVTAFLMRPDRPLPHEQYQSVMPVKSAELINGTFQCIVDETKWLALEVKDRDDRLAKFEKMLASEGNVQDMQCRDTQNRLVITTSGPNRIVGAAFFMKGDAHGVIPKPETAAKAAPK
jgi:hypothetical protein